MLVEFIKFEIKYRLKRPDTYIYFVALYLYSIIAIDFIYEGELDPLKRNSPYVIARTMGIVSALFMVVTSMVMGTSILRDFDHQMESLMFVNPIRKRDYLLGRFIGSFVILVFIFTGLLLGMMVGDIVPWRDPESLLAFNLRHYVQPFACLILPTLFFGAAFFFVSGALSRKLIIVYTQGFFFLLVYLFSMNLAKGSDDLFLTALIEPFTFQTIRIVTQTWTVLERNTLMIPMEGVLLFNRLMWLALGVLALGVGYYRFHFIVVRDKATKKQKQTLPDVATNVQNPDIAIPTFTEATGFSISLKKLIHHTVFTFRFIVSGIPFWTIVICGVGILLISSFNLGTAFGVDSYPTTYILIGELIELTIIFFLSIILFYSGELVWKERDIRMNGIYDALPVSDFINLSGKFIGLVLTYVLLIFTLIITGMLFQTAKGYYHYELDVYFIGFFVVIFPFLFLLTIICFFIQSVVNHKFLSHLVVLIVVFASSIVPKVLGFDHGLYTFGGSDLGEYSAMNGYGHFLKPFVWFKIYWFAFSLMLFIVASLLRVRGTTTRFKDRLKLIKQRLTPNTIILGLVALLIFTSSGCYIFYNTNILNQYTTQATQHAHQASYEKVLKKFEHLPQPKIVNVNLRVDLYPQERNYVVEGYYILTNTDTVTVDEIHIQKLPNPQVEIEYLILEGGATARDEFASYSYMIYELDNPMQPGDSIKMSFKQTYTTKGFTESKNTHVVYNGTLFDNFHFPSIGYKEDIELEDEATRKEFGLLPRARRAAINDPFAVLEGRAGGDGEEINFEIVISTDSSQTAIAPGYLSNSWVENDRNYFHYKMDKTISNFYSIASAEYEIKKDVWIPASDSLGDPVQLEIYYHKGHEFNLDRMMKGMKKSLDYFSKNFSPYQYRQLRTVETPIYKNNAQSFPNIVPFSEGIGFIMDIDDAVDADMVFFITAHEVAHQWWGHQVNPAHVQGMSMISETLAQYSALMVFEHEHADDKVQQLLKLNKNRYLKGRSGERKQEMPLSLVESGQEYIHYGKGLINMNEFKHYVSEDSVNSALKKFIQEWNSFDGTIKMKTRRYATTNDLLTNFRTVTPDSLQYVIKDLFETITFIEDKLK
jgi:ABC-2 type transport system permease protein